MSLNHNVSLKPFNTFGIDVLARQMISVASEAQLQQCLKENHSESILVLGGGSNILLTSDVEQLVLHINIKGISVVNQDADHVILEVKAGENWHDFVQYCLDHDYGGVENLALIPGNVGTAPIQNIGAYGVELQDVFLSCEAMAVETAETAVFHNADCRFGYRDSIFKTEYKGRYIITSVRFRLSKSNHQINMSYGAISEELEAQGITRPNIQDVARAVIAIRRSKLPDPEDIGNSGSFFKNPVITRSEYEELLSQFEGMPHYPVDDDHVKIPAAWLIEQAGFKGKDFGSYGVHDKQALVLVNYGNAKGSDILKLAKLIQNTIKRIFNINLTPEVNII